MKTQFNIFLEMLNNKMLVKFKQCSVMNTYYDVCASNINVRLLNYVWLSVV